MALCPLHCDWLWVGLHHSIHPNLVFSWACSDLSSEESRKHQTLTQQPGNLGEGSCPPLPFSAWLVCTGPPLPLSREPITSVYLWVLCCLPSSPPSSTGPTVAILDPEPPSHPLLTSRCQGNFYRASLIKLLLALYVLLNGSHCPEGKVHIPASSSSGSHPTIAVHQAYSHLPHVSPMLLKGLCCAPDHFIHSLSKCLAKELRITFLTYIRKVSLMLFFISTIFL